MTRRNLVAIALALGSLGLLWPGLVEPALTITASIEIFGVRRELANDTRSVIGAVQSLYESGNLFVAGLIVLFSVAIPLGKVAMLAPIVLTRDAGTAHRLARFVRAVSKWSMADVFAVGMLIALLAAKGTQNLDAVAGPGFYWFAAYCLVSNAAFQLLRIERPAVRAASPAS
jgi:paraquat-inducible protein A